MKFIVIIAALCAGNLAQARSFRCKGITRDDGIRVIVQGSFEGTARSLYAKGDLEIKASDGTGTFTRCQGTGRNSTVLGTSSSAPADGVRFFPAENIDINFPSRVFNLAGNTSNGSSITMEYVDNQRPGTEVGTIIINLQENRCGYAYKREFSNAKCDFENFEYPSLRRPR